MNRACVLWVVLCLFGAISARAQSPEDQYVRIYNLIQQADALNANGRFNEALPKYLEAQSALQRIQKITPEWNPKVVTFRLNYLAERIGAVPGANLALPAPRPAPATATNTAPPTAPVASGTPPVVPPPAAPATSQLQGEIVRLQAEKAILEAKLREALATQPAAIDARELTKAQQQIQSLLKENELLKTNLEAEKGKTRSPEANREMEELKTALAESNRKLAEQFARANTLLGEQQALQQQVDSLAASTNELARLQQSLTDANRRLADQTKLAEQSTAENASLRQRVTQLTASAGAAEALRAENAILKKQLADVKSSDAANPSETTLRAEAEARIAALQSDAQVLRLEKLALEDRLKKTVAAPATNNAAAAQRIKQLEQDRRDLQQQLTTATNAAPARARRELVAQVDQLTREVTGLRARVEVFEAKAIPYTAEELALFRTDKARSIAGAEPEPARRPARAALPAGSAALVAEAQRNFAAGDYDKAEQNYRSIVAKDQSNPTALANLATIQMEAGRLDDAEKTIGQALAVAPDDPYNLATLGKVKYQQDKYDEALDALSRAAKAIPQNAEIQNYLGVTLSQKGLRGPAETALRKAIQIDPTYASAHNNLAVMYATQNPPFIELARWHYQKALAAGHAKNADLEKLFEKKEAVNP